MSEKLFFLDSTVCLHTPNGESDYAGSFLFFPHKLRTSLPCKFPNDALALGLLHKLICEELTFPL